MAKPWEIEYDEGTPNPLKAFDAPPADEPSWSEVTRQALRSAVEQTAQSGQTAATGEPGAPLERTAFQDEPITLKGLIESPVRTAKKAVGMTLESSPIMGGGIAGAALGSEAGPLGTLIGGASGMALGNLVQTMGPNYARALQKYPNDPDKAYDESVRQTTAGTGGTFASGLLLGVNPFSSRLKNLLAQTFVVQPAAMEATAQVEAGQTGDTERQGFAPAAQAYVQNVVGSVPALGVGEAMHAVTADAAARQGGEPQPRVEPTLGTPPGDGAAPPPAPPPAPAGEPAKPAAAAGELNTAPGFKPWEMPWDAPPAAAGVETGPSAPAESVVPSAGQPPATGTLGPDAVAAAPGEVATAPSAVPASGPPASPGSSASSGPSATLPKTAPASRLGQPLRLASWLRRMGGVQDISGELAHMGADRVKGLVNPRGIPLDEAARLAQENGYLPQTFDADGYVDRAHLNDLLEVLYDDLGGRPVYSSLDAERITESQTRARLAEERRRSDFPGDRPRGASSTSRDDVPFQLRADPAQLPEQRAARDGEPAPHEAAQAFLNAARGDYERAIATVRERLASFTGARDKPGKVRAGLEKALADLEDPNRVRVTPQFSHVQGDGFRTFKLERAGRPVGVIIGRVEGSNFHIDAISTDAGGDVHAGGANTFNARVMRQVGRDLRAHLPASVETYSGDRVTGARHGNAARGMTAHDLLTGRLGERRQSNATIDARRLQVGDDDRIRLVDVTPAPRPEDAGYPEARRFHLMRGETLVGRLAGHIVGDKFDVAMITAVEGVSDFGPAAIRQIGRDLREALGPGIKEIIGRRVSGARSGTPAEVSIDARRLRADPQTETRPRLVENHTRESKADRAKGWRSFDIVENGKTVATLTGIRIRDEFYVDGLWGPDKKPVALGPKAVRQLAVDLKSMLPPEVTKITAERMTGARAPNARDGDVGASVRVDRLEKSPVMESPLGGLKVTGLTKADAARYKHALKTVGEVVRRIAPHIDAMPARKVEVEQGGRWVQPHGIFTDAGDFGRPLIVYALEGQKYKSAERYTREVGDVVKTARHEAIHALYRGGYFKPEEWRTLTRAAIENGWLEKHDIFKDYRTAKTDVKIEEAIAEEFAQGRPTLFKGYPEPVRKVFLKLHALLTQVKTAVLKVFGGDTATAERIIQAIESGEIGRRTPDIRNGPEGDGAMPPFKAAPEVRTPEFKRWFGDSKIVDDAGEPRVLYHGTRHDFDAFKGGAFFTSDPGVASSYSMRFGGDRSPAARALDAEFDALRAAWKAEGKSEWDLARSPEWQEIQDRARTMNSAVLPVFVRMENPFVFEATEKAHARFNELKDNKQWLEALAAHGYDGVIARSVIDAPISYTQEDGKAARTPADVVITFDPEQVKSVNNRGSFDPKSPNIMLQKAKGDTRTGELGLEGDARNPAKQERPATIADWVAQIEADPYTARRGESQADRLNRIRRVPGEPDDTYLRRLYGDRYDAVMADPEERRYAINKAGRLADFTDKKVSIGDGAFHEALRRANFNILPTDFGPQPKGVETLYLSHQTGTVGGGRIPYTVVVLHPGAEPPTRHPDVVYVREGEPIIDAISRLQKHYAQTVTRPNAQGRYMLQVASPTRR